MNNAQLPLVYIFNEIIHSLRDSIFFAENFTINDAEIASYLKGDCGSKIFEEYYGSNIGLNVDDLLEDYNLYFGNVVYYDSSIAYKPLEYNERQQIFSDFCDKYNDIEERVEFLNGDLLLLLCLHTGG